MKLQRCLIVSCTLLALALVTPAAAEIAPAGQESSIAAGIVASRLVAPAVAVGKAGEMVVAWEGYWQGLVGRRFDGAGRPAGPEIQLAESELFPRVPYRGPITLQREPAVVTLDRGELLAVWIEEVQHVSVDVLYRQSEVSSGTVVAQRLTPRGRPVGPRRVLSEEGLGIAGAPRAALLSDGRVLVVWHTGLYDEGEPGVYGRLLGRRGGLAGPVFRVDSPADPPGSRPVVAATEAGGFLVAWHACCDGDGPGVFARLYDSPLEPAGEAFRVNATQAGKQIQPAVARRSDGELLVSWMGPGEPGTDLKYGVYGQVLAPDGTLLGPELSLSRGGGRLHGAPAVVGTDDGYLVAWILWKGDFPVAVVASELDRNGMPKGDLLRLSGGPLGIQWRFALVGDGEGGYFAAWEGFDPEGNPSINSRRLVESASPGRSVELAPAGE